MGIERISTSSVTESPAAAGLQVDANVRLDDRLDSDFVVSIRDLGVLVPVVAVRTSEGTLRVRFGHRRVAAAVQAGLGAVPVVVVGDEDDAAAAQVERLPGQWAGRPQAVVWTEERVAHWKATGERPVVAVWTAAVGAARHEANLVQGSLRITQTIVQVGWETQMSAPKTDGSGPKRTSANTSATPAAASSSAGNGPARHCPITGTTAAPGSWRRSASPPTNRSRQRARMTRQPPTSTGNARNQQIP
jgi:ParB family chromosome partitioning protein